MAEALAAVVGAVGIAFGGLALIERMRRETFHDQTWVVCQQVWSGSCDIERDHHLGLHWWRTW